MVEYMLRDGVTEGNIARVMGWPIGDVERVRAALGEFRTHQAAERRRRVDRMYRAAVRHAKRFGMKKSA